MPSLDNWILAARPKTLVAAVVPVIVGAAYAKQAALEHWPFALCAALSALCIQIGTNLANDYSDFRRGADTSQRIGPVRVTQAGLIAPQHVKNGAILSFSLAVGFGIPLIARGGLPILLIGVLSILCGWLYTGGPFPLGYNGLGELFVLLFFGFAAVAGTHFVLTLEWNPLALFIALAPGLHASALLAVNNVRDLETDRAAGKRTLAAHFGRTFGRAEFALLTLLPFFVPVALFFIFHFSYLVLLPVLSLPLAMPPLLTALTREDGPSLISALAGTARLQLVFGVLLAAGLVL
ncbi:MAG: 1,4-dihydroxy-2-naphthoate polyprenyltransferase [bacterium]|nr:1,4-dihydroxy-2-naphthoate polyprenyltransferase [bacterium]